MVVTSMDVVTKVRVSGRIICALAMKLETTLSTFDSHTSRTTRVISEFPENFYFAFLNKAVLVSDAKD